MPWHISNKKEECSGYAVVKDDDGKVVGCHTTEAEAKAQLAALYASETKKDSSEFLDNIWNGAFFSK